MKILFLIFIQLFISLCLSVGLNSEQIEEGMERIDNASNNMGEVNYSLTDNKAEISGLTSPEGNE